MTTVSHLRHWKSESDDSFTFGTSNIHPTYIQHHIQHGPENLILQSACYLFWNQSTMWHYVAPCGTMWYNFGTMWYYVVLCGAMWYNFGAMWYYLALCGTMWHHVAPCGTMWHYVALHGSLTAAGSTRECRNMAWPPDIGTI